MALGGWEGHLLRGQSRTHSYRVRERLDCPSHHHRGLCPPLLRGVGRPHLNSQSTFLAKKATPSF